MVYAQAHGSGDSLADALLFCILFPVLESRFGRVKSSIFIAVVFGFLITAESFITNIVTAPSGLLTAHAEFDWQAKMLGFAYDFFSATSAIMLCCAFYFLSSRRIPGTCMLFTFTPSLFLMSSIMLGFLGESVNMISELIFPLLLFLYYLIVTALSLGVVAGFRHWKTFGAFAESARALMRKARTTQNDIEE